MSQFHKFDAVPLRQHLGKRQSARPRGWLYERLYRTQLVLHIFAIGENGLVSGHGEYVRIARVLDSCQFSDMWADLSPSVNSYSAACFR